MVHTLYFHLSGFVFTDSTYYGGSFMYKIINHVKKVSKSYDCEYNEAQKLSRSYHITCDDVAEAVVDIELYRKSVFDNEFLGKVSIPLVILPPDCVTMNTLQLVGQSYDSSPIGLRINLHLTETQQPYRAPIKEPTMMQMDMRPYMIEVHQKYETRLHNMSPSPSTSGPSPDGFLQAIKVATKGNRRRRNGYVINSI